MVQVTVLTWNHAEMLITTTVTLRMSTCCSEDSHHNVTGMRFSERQGSRTIWGNAKAFHNVNPSQTVWNPNTHPSSPIQEWAVLPSWGPASLCGRFYLQLQARKQMLTTRRAGGRPSRAPTKHEWGEKGGRKYVLAFSETLQSALTDTTETGGTQSQVVPSCADERLWGRAKGLTTAHCFFTSWPGSWWQQRASDRWVSQLPGLAVPFWDTLGHQKRNYPKWPHFLSDRYYNLSLDIVQQTRYPIYYLLDIFSALYALTHLIVIAILPGNSCYHPRVTDRETEAQRG